MKRVFDVTLSCIALLLLSPIMLAASIATLFDSGGPILYRQIRIGRAGQTFIIYKFRSMVTGAEAIGPYFTGDGDPRITSVGRFIRRTSIDELPQIFNVLRGDMSLIGPRPDVPLQRESYTEAAWLERCSVRPGITGLAQVKIRSQGTAQQRLSLDIQYVREADFLLDIKILWWTLGRLAGKGSN